MSSRSPRLTPYLTKRKPSLLRPSRLAVWQLDDRIVPAGTVTGSLFRDFNANGVFENAPRVLANDGGGTTGIGQDQPFLAASVTVRAFDPNNQLAGETASGPNGTYTLNLAGTGPYRIEFSNLPAGYSFGPAGNTNTGVGGAGTAVQFVPDGGATGVNLGLVRPEDITADNPLLATSQFVFGGIDQQNGNSPAVQAFPYSSGKTAENNLTGDPEQTIRNEYAQPTTHAISIPHSQVGAVWGLGYDRASQQLLMAAFFKRHSGYGPNGPGAIYSAAKPVSGQQTTTATLLVDLNAATDLGGGGANPAGVSFRPTTSIADNTDDRSYFRDGLANNVGWNSVGKQGLGGLDVSADGRFAYTVALGNRRFFVIDLQTRQVRSYAIPVPASATGTNGSDLQPFAVTVHNGQVYVGAVNTAESMYGPTRATNPAPGSADDIALQAARAAMQGYVFRFNPGADPVVGGSGGFVDAGGAAVTPATAAVFNFPLNYDRGYIHPGQNRTTTADDLPAEWRPWTPVYRNLGLARQTAPESSYPQPMFTGLAFDADGSMIIGLRDRAGDQFGVFTPSDPNDVTLQLAGFPGGDLLRAASNGNAWTFENNGTAGATTTGLPRGVNGADPNAASVFGQNNGQGPGGGEFYSGDYLVPSTAIQVGATQQEHQELFVGGVLQVPGFPDVAATAFDASQAVNGFNTGGVRWLFNAGPNAGTLDKAYNLYVQNVTPGVPPPLFAKTNGIGDLVALNDTSLEIGNRVWRDTNSNGIQDAGEPGIGGVQVVLFSGGNAIATTTTAADGSYLFSDQALPANPVTGRAYGVPLRTGASYQVRIPIAQAPLAGLQTTTFQAGLPAGASNLIQLDQVQSDAQTAGDNAVIDVAALGRAGANHTYDAGFSLIPTLNLGDFVWNDADNDGVFDAGEVGIPQVTVNLLNTAGATVGTAVTNANGGYLFTGLAPGQYRIEIPVGQTALSGLVSSSGVNGNRNGPFEPPAGEPANGVNNTDHGVQRGNVVIGPVVTLALGQAPVDETNVAPGNLGLADGIIPDNSSYRTQDFGFYQPLSLGDTVWVDPDNSGTRQTGEAGLVGVTVQLLDAAGGTVGVTTTNANGGYLFQFLQPGQYTVRLVRNTPLTGYASSTGNGTEPSTANPPINDQDAGTQSAGFITSPLITLTRGGANVADSATQPAGLPDDALTPATNRYRNVDFGLFPLLSLGDFVFVDANNNGVQDTGEVPVPGVPVELLDAAGTVLATTTTNADGLYLFTNLFAGQYRTRITPPAGFVSSTGTNGSATGPVEPAGGADIPGPIVNNRDNGVTQADGRIRTPLVNVTATNLNFDFGLYQPLSLGDLVWRDDNNDGDRDTGEAGIGGVVVTLVGRDTANAGTLTTTTQADGGYLFTNLMAGRYQVVIPINRSVTGGNAANPVLTGMTSSTGTNGSASGPYEPAPANAVNNQDHGTTVLSTTTPGQVPFQDVVGPVVNLQPGQAPLGEGNTAPTLNDPVADANSDRTQDFGFFRALSLGDLVWEDVNNNGQREASEPGIGGVVVTLVNVDNPAAPQLTATTAADGGYLFTNLIAGRYRVQITTASGAAPAPNPALTGFISSTGTNGSASGPYEPAPATAGNNQDHGTTVGAGGATIVQGPVVNLQPGTAPLGEGNAAPTLTDPAADADSDRTQDFGFFRPLAVGDLVWRDTDTDGRFDTNESGIAGVTVRLRDGTGAVVGTTITGTNGRYLFTNLAPGTYSVQIVPPSGLINTTPAPDAQPANDQNRGVNQADGTIAAVAFTLSPFGSTSNPDNTGAANLRQDFGLTTPANSSLGGTVYIDANINGLREAGEKGLPDVRVLLDGVTTGGTRITREQFTDANGQYLFTGLPAGTYVVREQTPTGTLYNAATNVGSVGGTAGTDITTGIVLPAGVNAINYDFGEILPVSTFGYVWQDVNSPRGQLPTDYNGVRDAGEFPIPGTTVTISGTAFAGTPYARPLTAADVAGGLSAVTGPNGRYDFPSLPPGTYTLVETQPTDYDDFREQNGDPYGPAPAITNDQYTGISFVQGSIRGPFNFGEGSTIDPDGNRRPSTDPTKREFLSSTRGRTTPLTEVNTTPAQINPGDSVPVARLNLLPTLTDLNRSGSISVIATGAGPGASPVVRVFDTAAGVERYRLLAYEQNFTGGVNVAVGDVDGDGVPDVVTAVANNGGPRVRVFSGRDATVLQDFFAYEPSFTGGLNLAVGDINGDGRADLITGTNIGGGPRVRVFSGRDGTTLQDYFAFDGDQRGGVRVAAADFNTDGRADIAATTGNGVPTRVRVFDAVTQTPTIDFAPFETSFTGGATIAVGDYDGDGTPDLIVGADVGGGPRVSVFNGRNQTSMVSFFAFEPTFTGGVRVASVDTDGDGRASIITGAGLGGTGRVSVYSGAGLTSELDFYATDVDQPNGVYVGAGATGRKVLPTTGSPVTSGQLNRVGAMAELPANFARSVTT